MIFLLKRGTAGMMNLESTIVRNVYDAHEQSSCN